MTYELIDRETVTGRAMYARLRDLVREHHEHLRDARIALAWCTSWKPDRDGRVTLGKMSKATDLARELAPYDFIMLLKRSYWEDVLVPDEHRTALMDHELCHGAVVIDDRTDEPVLDERGRKVWRIRKHDIEEFGDVVERHGLWKRDLEAFAAAMRRSAMEGHKPCDDCRDSPGWVPSTDGPKAMTRCPCWTAWQKRVADDVLEQRSQA